IAAPSPIILLERDLFLENPVDLGARIVRCTLRRESELLPFSTDILYERYRFSAEGICFICNLRKKVFFANSSFLYIISDAEHYGKATVCRAVRKVTLALKRLLPMKVVFPGRKPTTYKIQFYEYGNFPGVTGCIDRCHVPVKCPSTEVAELCVFTPDMQFFNIVARWSSSTHDSKIFQNSSLCAQLKAREHSGYGQTHFLFTLHLHPVRPDQQRYNKAHIRSRGLVECMFGIWKNRFQCLRNTLCFEPRRCCIVIVATAVLYNYLRQHDCIDPPNEYYNHPHVPMAEVANGRTGHAYRNSFALQHFS
uniref:DDE Tnp4 domain-containing protein n=1 Tax=Echeneis naucrates TaxID=173247 RepID=A0A665WAX2_ECHNA